MKPLDNKWVRQPILVVLAISIVLLLVANLCNLYPMPADATNKIEESYQKQLQLIKLEQIKKSLNACKSTEEIRQLLNDPFFAEDKVAKLIEIFQDRELNNFLVKREILSLLSEKLANDSQQIRLKSFFWEVAKGQDLALAQEALVALIQNNEQEALPYLVQHLENYKLARYPDGSYVKIPWEIIQEIYKSFPTSTIAKGLKEIEKITGHQFVGAEQTKIISKIISEEESYRPKWEIPRWEKWLEKYPGHIATELVTYRIGRSYEILGQYAQALNWLHTALNSPDGTMGFQVYGRIIYLIDVKMSAERIEAVLNNPNLKQELRPLLEYTLAIKLARSGQYQEAVERFQYFVKKYQELPVNTLKANANENALQLYYQTDPDKFWTRIKEQQARLTELAAYARQVEQIQAIHESAPLRYEIAALIYHNPYIFYNHFWQGRRVHYNWLSDINQKLNYPPIRQEMESFVKEHNNYFQALQLFQKLKEIKLSPDLAEKVDFSIALCYAHLENYGKEIEVLWSEEEQKKLALEAFQNYLAKYPQGNYRQEAIQAIKAYESALSGAREISK